MQRWLIGATVCSTLAWCVAGPARGAGDEATCHGTAVHFVPTPSEAARKARDEQKLVFVLHVSGHFEDPGIT